MDLKQLEHFIAAADEKHFTRAARKMNIVQSGLSTSIRSLEQELGAPLFVRTTRRVELTVAGRVLYDKALAIVAGARDARRAVAAITGLERGTLSIGTCASLNAFFDLPLLLGEFHALHPAIDIRLCHSTAASLMEKVKNGSIDLAFLPLYEKGRDVITIPIAADTLVVACPGDHPLAGQSNVTLQSLAGETFVDFQPEQGTRRIVDRAFAAVDVTRTTALEVGDVQVLLDLVARGFGIALVPQAFTAARASIGTFPKIGVATLKRPGLRWELVVAFAGKAGAAQSRNPTIAAFTDVLSKVRAEGPAGLRPSRLIS